MGLAVNQLRMPRGFESLTTYPWMLQPKVGGGAGFENR